MWADLQVPIYDFKVSQRVGYKTVKVPISRVVIVEGIYALSARIRYSFPQATFMMCSRIQHSLSLLLASSSMRLS